MRARLPAAAAVLALTAASARADEDDDRWWEEITGEIRAGWRFLHGEADGRFPQDHALSEGPRLFDAEVRGETREDERPLWFDAEAHDVGEQEQSYRLRGGRRGDWELTGGFDRDDFSYRATGDPFPYDTVRERSDLGLRWTPTTKLTFRLDWARSLRRGDAWVGVDTDIREDPPPPGVDVDRAQEHRPLRQQSDRVTLGVDARLDGGFRASLAQSVRLAQIDDTRLYDIPPDRRGDVPVREALRREVRSPAWTTVAKAGWTSPDDALDVGGIFSYTLQPYDTRLSGRSRGFDPAFDAGIDDVRGAFRGTTDGENDTERDALDARLETTWRPARKWELTAGLEREEIVDDASLRLTTRRRYENPAVADTVTPRSLDARIVNRLCRASLEAQYEFSDALRLRVGEEYLRENLRVPTDTRTDDFSPTNFSATTWRAMGGVDWEPRKDLDLSLLVRRSMNDEPHAATSADIGDEISARGRWKASDALSLTSVFRHKGYRQDDDFDSSSRSDSGSVGATWTHEKLTVSPNVTYQVVDTRTDTSFLDFSTGSFRPIRDQVSFESRDVIGSLDVRYAMTKRQRVFLTVSWITSRGDYQAHWDEASLGAERDLRDDLAVGAALRSWRLDESRRQTDDYRALGVDVWVTWRF